MSINREELNNYYKKINELIDDYIDKWKIRPSQLKRYLKPGSKNFSKFLERNGLNEVKNIERILTDVLEDRHNEEIDGIITFESFKLFESVEYKYSSLKECLYRGISKSDISMEKTIADLFDTNLGSIDIIDSEKRTFSVNDWQGENLRVVIYSQEDLEIIAENMSDFIFDEISNQRTNTSAGISFLIGNFIDEISTRNKINEEVNTNIIGLVSKALGDDFKFMSEFNGYYVWTN
jgi:hypothetical protein